MRIPGTSVALCAGIVMLAGGVSGCMPNSTATVEFEGFTQSGQRFEIWRLKEWCGRRHDNPYTDELFLSGKIPEGFRVHGNGRLSLSEQARSVLGFDARTENNRVWLLHRSTRRPFVAVDFAEARVYQGKDLPSWASLESGEPVPNLVYLRGPVSHFESDSSSPDLIIARH